MVFYVKVIRKIALHISIVTVGAPQPPPHQIKIFMLRVNAWADKQPDNFQAYLIFNILYQNILQG